jgi:hypothetical protein
LGPDGLLHTTANAHEMQWNVKDPTTNIAAMQALFPVVASAAQVLGTDANLVSQLNTARSRYRPTRAPTRRPALSSRRARTVAVKT